MVLVEFSIKCYFLFSSSECSTRNSVTSPNQSLEIKFQNIFVTLFWVSSEDFFSFPRREIDFFLADKDQEVDLEPRGGGLESGEVRSLEGGGAEGRVMCTIRGVGNKALNHINSLPALQNKVRTQPQSLAVLTQSSSINSLQVPKYGVMTAFEDELGQNLDNIKIWGIDVFKISEFSNNKPLTAVTYRVFQVGSPSCFKL